MRRSENDHQWRVGGTLVLAGLSALIYAVGRWEAGGVTPNLGTYLSAIVAALSFGFVLPDMRSPGRKRLCLLGIAIAFLVLGSVMSTPCVEPCK